MQSARTSIGRVARGALFAASAVALSECSSAQPMYGGPCLANPDACVFTQPDSSTKDSASDAPSEAAPSDASTDASTDAPDGD